MKLLFLGPVNSGQTSLMRMRAFERLGHTVRGIHTVEPWTRTSWLKRQTQRRLQRGSLVDEINRSVREGAREFRPDLVWAEKQAFLRAETIQELRQLGAKTVYFTPDPYFSVGWKRTRLMDEAMRAFDALVYCKSYERKQYEALARPLSICRLGIVTKSTALWPPTMLDGDVLSAFRRMGASKGTLPSRSYRCRCRCQDLGQILGVPARR
jgi:hypothetical protein